MSEVYFLHVATPNGSIQQYRRTFVFGGGGGGGRLFLISAISSARLRIQPAGMAGSRGHPTRGDPPPWVLVGSRSVLTEKKNWYVTKCYRRRPACYESKEVEIRGSCGRI